MQTHFTTPRSTTRAPTSLIVRRRFPRVWRATKKLAAHIGQYPAAWNEAYAAAALYEDLSRLSGAELERRGIPPGDLYRHVSETLTRDTRLEPSRRSSAADLEQRAKPPGKLRRHDVAKRFVGLLVSCPRRVIETLTREASVEARARKEWVLAVWKPRWVRARTVIMLALLAMLAVMLVQSINNPEIAGRDPAKQQLGKGQPPQHPLETGSVSERAGDR